MKYYSNEIVNKYLIFKLITNSKKMDKIINITEKAMCDTQLSPTYKLIYKLKLISKINKN